MSYFNISTQKNYFCGHALHLFLCVLLSSVYYTPSYASTDIPTVAEYVMITDFTTGRTLMEKNKDAPMKPASMAKLMTVYIAFQYIAEGNLALTDQFFISEKAWKMGGSRSFLNLGDSYNLEELLNGVVVQSGNDATVALAEGISGSEDNFVLEMNFFARQMGMNDTVFTNSTGWPHPELTTTATDLNILATRLIKDFPSETYPELYPMFSKITYTLNDIKQGNRNPLLYGKTASTNGVDGLKTGFTDESGYGLVASALRNGQRIIMVLNGMESKQERATESRRLIDFMLREFSHYAFFEENQKVDEADVWLGKNYKVPLVTSTQFSYTLSRSERKNAEVKISWKNPVLPPITKGDTLGEATLYIGGRSVQAVPLIAGESVDALGTLEKLWSIFQYFIFHHPLQASQ